MEISECVINNRYRLLNALGGGAQGNVYGARDLLDPDRPLALKTLGSGTRSALLQFEFEQLSRLQHPHLVRVYDLELVQTIDGDHTGEFVKQGTIFFTQDLVHGEPSHRFARKLTTEGREEAVARVIVAVSRALAMLHSRGLLHRDIKPSNILVSENAADIRLIDLGLAMRTGSTTSIKAGTVGFMAPEALLGFPDERSDIFALGVTMAQLLSNRPPRAGYPISEKKPPYVGEQLWQLISRLVDKNPDRRLQTAREVALALGRIVGNDILGNNGELEFLDAASDIENKSTRVSRARSPYLIGRDEERDALLKWIDDTLVRENGKIGKAIIAGVPGVGKSRLFDAVVADLKMRALGGSGKHLTGLSGSLRSLVRSFVGRESDNWPLAGVWSGANRTDVLRTGDSPGGSLLSLEISRVIGSLGRGTVLFVEDGDGDLTQGILPWLDEVEHAEPLAVILEMRHIEAARELAEDWGAALFEVRPLSHDKESALTTEILGRDPGRGFTARLHRLTGGVPLLTEAVMSMFVSYPHDAELSRASLDGVDFSMEPAKVALDGLLLGLDDASVSLAKALSVLDVASDIKDVATVAGIGDGASTLSAVNQLESRRLFVLDEIGYVRMPGFVSRALYQYMGENEKRSMHRTAFEVLCGNDHGDVVQLARHAVVGGLHGQAEKLLCTAKEGLKAVGDLEGAAEQLKLLLSLPNVRNKIVFETELARLYRHTGHYEAAIELALSIEAKGGETIEPAILERAAALRLSGEMDEAYGILVGLIQSENDDVALEARALAARIDLDRGDVEAAKSIIGGFSTDPDFRLVRAGTYTTAGLIALTLRDKEKAQRIFATGREAALTMGDLRSRAKFNALFGMVCHLWGELGEAKSHYKSAFNLAKKAGDRHGAATYAVNLAAAFTELGEVKDALRCYHDGLKRLRRVGRIEELVQAGANYSQLLLRVGDLEGSNVVSEESVANSEETGKNPARAHALRVRGDVLLALRRNEHAKEVLLRAEELAKNLGVRAEVVSCQQLLAEVHLPADAKEAREWLKKAAASGADTNATSRLEQNRLGVEIARAEGKKIDAPFEALLDCLDLENTQMRTDHVKALVVAAKAAFELERLEDAKRVAGRAIDVITDLQKATPSLHREVDSPILSEMEEIVHGASHGSRFTAQNTSIAARDWERLVRINTRLNSETRIGPLLEMIMDTAIDIMDAERGFLLIIDGDDELSVRCARNISKESLLPGERNYSRSVAFRATEKGEPILTTDAQEDDRFQSMLSVVNLSLRYIAAVPLQIKGKTMGAVYVDSKQGGHFDEEKLDLLKSLSDQAAIALANARLMDENRQRQKQIETLLKQVKAELETREGELEKVKEKLALHTGEVGVPARYPGIIARSPAMEEVFHLLDRIVDSDLPVVVQGESGTGKELIAKALHFSGLRKRKPFVAENCAAIPESLLESVLFGHIRGAFTGAVNDKKGLFVEADSGTLFLDEVSAMPLTMQVKLLRVLQESTVRPVGGSKTTKVDVRILVASNTDLALLVKKGDFREDLYYRLNVVTIKLPPLRKRKEDIVLLAKHFLQKHGGEKPPRFSREVFDVFMEYPWPGNVRQLENEVMRAVLLGDGIIELEHLSEDIIAGVSQLSEADMDFDMTRQVDTLKKRLVTSALKKTGGNQTVAAELLGLSRFGLQKMLARLNIQVKKTKLR